MKRKNVPGVGLLHFMGCATGLHHAATPRPWKEGKQVQEHATGRYRLVYVPKGASGTATARIGTAVGKSTNRARTNRTHAAAMETALSRSAVPMAVGRSTPRERNTGVGGTHT